ncbi:MAG: cupin domain-containing protein [Flavisolibacter sp.]
MQRFELKDFTGGWFVGDFDPSLVKTGDFEVAVKNYKAGAKEKKHYHKIAVEYTLIASGKVHMNGKEFEAGCIIRIDPGEATDFEAITDTTTVVVKLPSVKNDKYLV